MNHAIKILNSRDVGQNKLQVIQATNDGAERAWEIFKGIGTCTVMAGIFLGAIAGAPLAVSIAAYLVYIVAL